MRKTLVISFVIIGLLAIGTSVVRSNERENTTATTSELAKILANSFTLAPSGTTETGTSSISGYLSVWQRFGVEDPPESVSGFSAGRAAEFATSGNSAGAGFGIKGIFGDKSAFDLKGKFYDPNEQYYDASLDLGRIIRTETTVNRFLHRLDHDPLTNIHEEGVLDSEGTDLREEFPFDDQNPEGIYSTTRTEILNKTDLVIPSFPNLKIKSQVRYIHENGLQQARTLDQCAGCHVVGQTQGIDQKTQDFILGAELSVKGAVVSYSHLGRTFENNAPPNYHDYTNPYRRFIYSGKQEFANIPDSEKNADTIKAKVDAMKNASLFGSYTIAKVKNKGNNGEAKINNFQSRVRALVGKALNITLKFTKNKYENEMSGDSIYSPTTTITANHLSKDGTTFGADASFRIPNQKINLRAGFDYNTLKRDFTWSSKTGTEERDAMEKFLEETKTTTFNAGLTFYPTSKFRGFLRYKMKSIDKPFGLVIPSEENPIDPTVDRFMSSLYTNVNLLSAGLTFVPSARVALSANYFFNSSSNDDIHSSQKLNNLIFSLWYGLSNKVSLTASYTYLKDKIVNTLIFGNPVGWKYVKEDKDVPYNKNTNVFTVAVDLRPSEQFSLFGDLSLTNGKSDWTNKDLLPGRTTSDIPSLSDMDITHTRLSAGANYSFLKNMSVFAKWMFEDYKDKAFTLYKDSGSFHLLYVGFGYKF